MVVVLIGAFLLRLWHLGALSIWTDEGSAWTAATSSLRDMIRFCAQKDASPPLYYLLTSLFVRLADDEAHLRFVSVLASVGMVWLTYRLARLVARRSEAVLAATIVAISPFQLMYAQEARSYMLVALFSVVSFYLYVRAALLGRSRAWPSYVAVTTLALYTQSIVVLSLGVQAALAVLTAGGRRRLKPWLIAITACLVLFLPWLIVTIGQMGRLGESHWYLNRPDFQELFQVPRAVFLSPTALVRAPHPAPTPGLDAVMPSVLAHLLLIVIPLLPLIALVPSLLEPGRRGFLLRVLFLALVLPLAVVAAAIPWKPLWLPRYFVLLTPFYAVMLARGLVSLHPRWLARAWTVLFLAAAGYACFRYDLDYSKERWREVAAFVGRESTPDRSAVLVTFDLDPFRFYNVKLPHPVAAFEMSHPEVPFSSSYDDRQLAEMTRIAGERTAPYDEVWVVVRSPNSPVRHDVARRAEAVAATGRLALGHWVWNAVGGPLRVSRYRKAPVVAVADTVPSPVSLTDDSKRPPRSRVTPAPSRRRHSKPHRHSRRHRGVGAE